MKDFRVSILVLLDRDKELETPITENVSGVSFNPCFIG